MRKSLLAGAAAALLGFCPSPQDARAQLPVLDAANLVENIVSAVQTTATVLQQITQIAQEVQSLAYQLQNLQPFSAAMAASILNQYTAQFGNLVAAMQQINGIAQNVATVTALYNGTYPNDFLAQGPLSSETMTAEITEWLNQSRSVYQGAYNTQAQVIATLAPDANNLQQLLAQSGGSQGALDAIEAGTQMGAQVASQLMKMNQQMAALNQSQMNWIAEQTQMVEQGLKIAADQVVGFTAGSSAVVDPTYNRFH